MASPQGAKLPFPEAFSAQDRFMATMTEEAIRDGLQLEAWMRRQHAESLDFPLSLNRPYGLPNKPFGYFGTVDLNGKPTSLMGCRQEIEFGKVTGPGDAGERLRNFVLGEFLPRAHWQYPDGNPGGFTIEQSLYRTSTGEYGKFSGESRNGCVDWRRLGSDYDWVLLTVQIHDFVMNFGPVTKRFQEAACIALQPDFVHIVEKPAPGFALEVAVGYPFVEFAPIPNVFGFGPGKFGNACKLYSFRLADDKSIQVIMNFAAAPRCRKVFDFGSRVPDPVYGGAALLQQLTFGKWDPAPFHNKLDAGMLAQHCRVHQALMEGVSKVFRDWSAGGRD
jgi:hypothetical protein